MEKTQRIQKIQKWTTAFGVLVGAFAISPQLAFGQTRCLDYWTAGPAKCQPKKTEKAATAPQSPQTLPPAPQVPQAKERPLTEEEQKEADLQKDIEQFYDRHGKPPEEFVRFYMDPSPQNALAWVKKYNESILRSRQLAAAWTQAQKIYDDFETQGLEVPPELLPDYARDPKHQLPPVRDLGVPIEGEDVFTVNKPATQPLQQPAKTPPFVAPTGNQLSVTISSGSLTANLPPEALTNSPIPTASASQATAPQSDQIKVSYYFSAECPFCKKFEPGFRKIIKELGNKVDVTCVDMTPSGQTQANINGKVDCAWRPLQPGEMQALGIEATPTLIVDRGPDKPLERLSGFVDEQKLRSYLVK